MDAKQVLALIKEKDVKFVDFRFTDPRGKWQHTARMASATDEGTFEDGVMFDGSSIAGWKAINESDMILMPDPSTAVLDPFAAQTTLIVSCDVVEPSTGQLYARCPRSTAKRAEAFMKSSGIGRDGGDYSFDFYMETKNIAIALDSHKIPKIGID